MDRNQRNVLILASVALLLLVVLFYVLLLGPQREELAELQDERDARQEQLDQLEAEVAELEEIQRNAPEIERELLELSRRVPEQAQIPTFVVQVEEIAGESGVTQLLIEPGDPEQPGNGGDYTIIPITMSFEGGYDELQDFVARLQNLTRLVAVEDVVYEAVEEEGETPSPQTDRALQIELGVEVYAQPGGEGLQTNSADGDSETTVEESADEE